eukprot:gnl/TRDRNA2_/TRDRNA2_197729_c0_seq1.p1 gnl/TRDRNA2_/TRDRNA2_197729_c0~~gnl/TRDRNA2_/TRDRNA2_197729_c0_seq1.p1  ORF type:complete len:673 (-),score=163.98 gnl/TRDRNA2_/TRDRNA2_197729_c0_seq1:82-2046(-)
MPAEGSSPPKAAGAAPPAAAVPGGFAAIYVGDLQPEVTEPELFGIFNAVGPVVSVRVCRDRISKRSLGYGYVNFLHVKDAERAVDALNHYKIQGRACRIMWSHRDASLRRSGCGNITVRNLSSEVDSMQLHDAFSLFGNIFSCKVAVDSSGASLGHGFVQYETAEEAKEAIAKMNGVELCGQALQVAPFTPSEKEKEKEGKKDEAEFSNNVYVKCFPQSWGEEELRKLLAEYGEITSLALRSDKWDRKFALVNFADGAAADAAIGALHEKDMGDEAKTEGKKDEETKLYVQRTQSRAERAKKLQEEWKSSDKGRSKGGGDGAAGKGAQSDEKAVEADTDVFVRNLSTEVDEDKLKALFAPFGEIKEVKLVRDWNTKQSKGVGFCVFYKSAAAAQAIQELHLKVPPGGETPLYVCLSEDRDERKIRLQAEAFNNWGKGKAGAWDKGGANWKGGQSGGWGKGGGWDNSWGGGKTGPPPWSWAGKGNGKPGDWSGSGYWDTGKGKGGPAYGGMPFEYGPPPMGKGFPMMPPGPPTGPPPGSAWGKKGGKGMPDGMSAEPSPPGLKGGKGAKSGPDSGKGGNMPPPDMSPLNQRRFLGEKLFPLVSQRYPDTAGKLTGMLLEMEIQEIVGLLKHPSRLERALTEATALLQREAAAAKA